MERNENENPLIRRAKALLNERLYEKAVKMKIAIMGLGGAGGNCLVGMNEIGLKDVKNIETIAINSEEAVLAQMKGIDKRVVIGKNMFEHPKGTGGNLMLAKKMVESARESIEVLISPYPELVLVAGLGGGTGSELMLEISDMAVKEGKVVIAVPIMPFSAEGSRRSTAKKVLGKLEKTGAVIVPLDNDVLAEKLAGMNMEKAMRSFDRMIMQKIKELRDDTMEAVIKEVSEDIMERIAESPGEAEEFAQSTPVEAEMITITEENTDAPMIEPENAVTAKEEPHDSPDSMNMPPKME